jgi:hypothetical protein
LENISPMPAALKREGLSRCMALACGVWGWDAERFWRATPFDIVMISGGLQILRGGNDFGAEDAEVLRALLDKKVSEHGLR